MDSLKVAKRSVGHHQLANLKNGDRDIIVFHLAIANKQSEVHFLVIQVSFKIDNFPTCGLIVHLIENFVPKLCLEDPFLLEKSLWQSGKPRSSGHYSFYWSNLFVLWDASIGAFHGEETQSLENALLLPWFCISFVVFKHMLVLIFLK